MENQALCILDLIIKTRSDEMKRNKLIKAIILLCKIILIILTLSILLLTVYELVLGFTKKEENQEWVKEDKMINQMMADKLSNKYWSSPSPIWKYEHEGKLPPKGNKKRILVVGDSYVWGDGYTNPNMLFWQQLRNKLALNGYNEVEIVALGLCGYSTYIQFEQLSRDEIRNEIDPDFIIFGYVNNDPELRDENGKLLIHSRSSNDIIDTNKFFGKWLKKLWPNVYNKLNEIIIEKYKNDEAFKKKYGYEYGEWVQTMTADPYDKLYEERALLPLKKLLAEKYNGIEYLFVPLVSYPYETEYDNFRNTINIFERNDINYYYFLSELFDKYPGFTWDNASDWFINPVNMHPSYKATNFYAEAIYNELIRSYGHIIGPKSKDIDLPLEINDTTPYMLNAKLTYKNTYEFTYPKKGTENAFLTLPIKKPYVKLNLKYPKKITRIEITGENIESIHLFTNQINKELGYDDDKPKDLGEKEDVYIWEIKDEEITSINISAKIKGDIKTKMIINFDY